MSIQEETADPDGSLPAIWREVADYIRDTLGVAELPAAEIARLSGIKAVNACSLAQCGLEGTALYPVYPLMNSYCYCNTMYTIHPHTKVTGTPGYLDISSKYLHS